MIITQNQIIHAGSSTSSTSGQDQRHCALPFHLPSTTDSDLTSPSLTDGNLISLIKIPQISPPSLLLPPFLLPLIRCRRHELNDGCQTSIVRRNHQNTIIGIEILRLSYRLTCRLDVVRKRRAVWLFGDGEEGCFVGFAIRQKFGVGWGTGLLGWVEGVEDVAWAGRRERWVRWLA